MKRQASESNGTRRQQNRVRIDPTKRKRKQRGDCRIRMPEVWTERTKLSRERPEPNCLRTEPNQLRTKLSNMTSLLERLESDSGFSTEASPSSSGRSSPSPSSTSWPTLVVSLDCEMVGTGPGGRCSELARCSILDYHGNILYDHYIHPRQRVTDFRTRWSGIQKHHLTNATEFDEAREQVMSLLEGKVVVGHAIHNDFEALNIIHPDHMVRDTSACRLLSRLAGFQRGHYPSLRALANKLLNRRIQVGGQGHCSVQDAQAALDLYKLVEGEWEQDQQLRLRDDSEPLLPSFAASSHYMHDEYWPCDLTNQSESSI